MHRRAETDPRRTHRARTPKRALAGARGALVSARRRTRAGPLPALEPGNRFSARVFPIPANGKKELILSYSQELVRADEPYVIPLVGLPKLGHLHIRALVGSKEAGAASSLGGRSVQQRVVEVRRTDWMPDRDFEVEPAPSQGPVGLRHENLVVARVQPFTEARPDPVPSLLVEQRKGRRYARVLLVSDGVATAGNTEGDALLARVRGLAKAGVERLDALSFGGLRDAALLSRLVNAGLARAGVVATGDRSHLDAARRLGERTEDPNTVDIPGAEWVWPRTLEGLQSGDFALIYADSPGARDLQLRLGQNSITDSHLSKAERPLLERAWVKARIERLLRGLADILTVSWPASRS